MKKTKLFLASGLLAAPVLATIPVLASCHKAELVISAELTEYTNIEVVKRGDSYIIYMSIKELSRGGQYLPNALASVKTGDKTLSEGKPEPDFSNDEPNYYIYRTYTNNTKAVLYIHKYEGPISIEGSTYKLTGIEAVGVDVTGSGIAEFEIGEYLTNTTDRVQVTGKLENGDEFVLDKGRYTINIPGHDVGKDFTQLQDTKNDATVTYANRTSNTFKYKVIESTQAFVRHKTDTEETVDKYKTLQEAATAYNAGGTGDWTINVLPNYKAGVPYYEVTQPITINQRKQTNLVFRSYYDPFPVGEEWEYPIVIKGHIGQGSTINIKPDNNGTADSSIQVYGIQYDAFDDDLGAATTFSHITLGNGVHDVSFDGCNFVGNSNHNVFGVSSESSASNSNIYFDNCLGRRLSALFTGSITHNTTGEFDFEIKSSLIKTSREIAEIKGDSDVKANFYYVKAEVFWEKSGGLALPTGAIKIAVSGNYIFRFCDFYQMSKVSNQSGFIQIVNDFNNEFTGELNFEGCYLNKATDAGEIHDVLNSTNGSNSWRIEWVDTLGKHKQEAVVYGDPATGEFKYWTHS